MLYCKHIIWLTIIQDPRYRVSHSLFKPNKSFTHSSIMCCVLGWYNLSKQITYFGISTQNCKGLVRNIMNFISDTAFTITFHIHIPLSSIYFSHPWHSVHHLSIPIFYPYLPLSMVSLSFFISNFFLIFFCVNPSFSEITAQLK